MKKKKLTLSRETLRILEAGQMTPVVGGSGCPTCADQTCGSCYGSCFESCTCDMSCLGSCNTCDHSCPCI
jgi:hypothetical protein